MKIVRVPHVRPIIEEYLCFIEGDLHAPIKQYFGTRAFTLRDTDQTGRVINHWESYKLLPDHRLKDGKGWRSFSIIDLTWIRVLIELREIGFGLEKLRNSYKSVFEANTFENKISLFEFAIFSVLFNRESIHLLITPNDGKVNIFNRKDLQNFTLSNQIIDNFIHINLEICMQKVKPDADYFSDLPMTNFEQGECK